MESKKNIKLYQSLTKKIPNGLLIQIAKYLQNNALEVVNIFRISGEKKGVLELFKNLTIQKNIDFTKYDFHVIASVFKMYFRYLEPPLIPYKLYQPLISIEMKNEPTKLDQIASILVLLPTDREGLFWFLLWFLNEVSLYCVTNNMDLQNLSIVFGPNLFRKKKTTPKEEYKDSPFITKLMIYLIENQDALREKMEENQEKISKNISTSPKNTINLTQFSKTNEPKLIPRNNRSERKVSMPSRLPSKLTLTPFNVSNEILSKTFDETKENKNKIQMQKNQKNLSGLDFKINLSSNLSIKALELENILSNISDFNNGEEKETDLNGINNLISNKNQNQNQNQNQNPNPTFYDLNDILEDDRHMRDLDDEQNEKMNEFIDHLQEIGFGSSDTSDPDF
ncbi:spermathecal physiology variant [Anaeramoeba ignava]|uniref:Spermathecal physiology variant n=1 Tax=Anaeramoeba ignava TaxID=1746090 RepID=A0A9Q0LT80_ANAIG|nr:spermathecal physiology variant [Anaeramoeba ignava]